MKSKITREQLRKHYSAPDVRRFWEIAEQDAEKVKKWPKWKRDFGFPTNTEHNRAQ